MCLLFYSIFQVGGVVREHFHKNRLSTFGVLTFFYCLLFTVSSYSCNVQQPANESAGKDELKQTKQTNKQQSLAKSKKQPKSKQATHSQQPSRPKVFQVTISGPITVSAMEALTRAIEEAERAQAHALIVQLDTPGGFMKSMDSMVRRILNSKVTIITYVGPPGASSGSAGVFILYASHIAAMAPATNLGSATPVMMGGGSKTKGKDESKGKDKDAIPKKAGVDDNVNMKRKIFNHARAQLRSLAQYHGRNVKFGERSITEALNITAQEALKKKVIDILATNVQDLLEQADGRQVRLVHGKQTLKLKGAELIVINRDFRQRILDLIADPAIASILMMLGMLGLLIEIKSPGLVFPGVVGAVSLVLGLYAVHTLSLDYTALALLGLSIVFFVLELQIMSYGLLSLAGIISLVLGSLMLVRSGEEFTSYSISIVIVAALITGISMAFLIYLVSHSQKLRQMSGAEAFIYEKGRTRTEVTNQRGTVLIHSELWQARSLGTVIPADTPIRILSREGLTIIVEAIEKET